MQVLHSSRALLAMLLAALLLGCVAKPPESRLVLSYPHTRSSARPHRHGLATPPARADEKPAHAGEPRAAADRAIPVPPAPVPEAEQSSPAPQAATQVSTPTALKLARQRRPRTTGELSPAAKQNLFHDFEDYLSKSGHPQ